MPRFFPPTALLPFFLQPIPTGIPVDPVSRSHFRAIPRLSSSSTFRLPRLPTASFSPRFCGVASPPALLRFCRLFPTAARTLLLLPLLPPLFFSLLASGTVSTYPAFGREGLSSASGLPPLSGSLPLALFLALTKSPFTLLLPERWGCTSAYARAMRAHLC